jgi:hypothetical protein
MKLTIDLAKRITPADLLYHLRCNSQRTYDACRHSRIKRCRWRQRADNNPGHVRGIYDNSIGLREAAAALNFQRFSIFQPSMLLTKTKCDDAMQGIMLATWSAISFLLCGCADKYRGISVVNLGCAMAHNLRPPGQGMEVPQ